MADVAAVESPRVDLVWFGTGDTPRWTAGEVAVIAGWRELGRAWAGLTNTAEPPEAVLFWSLNATPPPSSLVAELLAQPDDVWHAGLRLGMACLPHVLDFVAPTWRFNRDAPVDIPSMSWRLSFAACLLRTSAVSAVGAPDTEFETETAAGLDYGRRLLTAGALIRYEPQLTHVGRPVAVPTLRDELRFVARHHGRGWMLWSALRGARAEPRLTTSVIRSVPQAWTTLRPDVPAVERTVPGEPADLRVMVLIPTIERYPYLRTVLDQLRRQTIPPHQVVVIDQTPAAHRDERIADDFADLPLELILLDDAGQSTARNAGLRVTNSDAVLFIDDDDEIEPDLIERHLRALAVDGVEVSCGIAHEPSLAVAHQPLRPQASDVFPTNNAMVRMSALEKSGLFDLAFDHGVRADGDLGMRLYLAGCRMVLDPSIDVLHHRAPRGGLRQYGERKTTYTGSRSSYLERQRLSPTEVYLARRYFTDRQVRESLVLRLLGTLSRHGSIVQRALRLGVQAVLLPSTLCQMRQALAAADRLCASYPQIPTLSQLDG